jgi:hypothetical protein
MALQLVEVCRQDGLTVVSLAAVIVDESKSTDLKTQVLMLAEACPSAGCTWI